VILMTEMIHDARVIPIAKSGLTSWSDQVAG
jgi:hypothetical protein